MIQIDLDYLNGLGGGDNNFVIDMLQTYIEETNKDMQELRQALTNQDVKRITFLAHRSKAAFRMLGLESMADNAEKIEKMANAEDASVNNVLKDVTELIADAETSFQQAKDWIDKLKTEPS